MKNMKGFTLIEIIICVSLLAIIGTAAFFGVKAINKNIRVKELKQITEKALLAAEVYLESDKESYDQLYKNENGVILPLQLLINKGLLSLDNTDLTESEIEDEYVITMLAGDGPGSSGCVDVRSVTSWDEAMSEPIYICTKSDGSSSLTTISASEIGNANMATKEPYIYSGANPNNYIMYGSNGPYRIYYIDVDDSLVLVTNKNGFGNVFNGKTDTLSGYVSSNYPDQRRASTYYNNSSGSYNFNVGATIDNNEKGIIKQDFYNACLGAALGNLTRTYTDNSSFTYSSSYPGSSSTIYFYGNASGLRSCWFRDYMQGVSPTTSSGSDGVIVDGYNKYTDASKKIRLNKCMKITSGTGTVYEPFQISDAAC